MIEEYQRAFAEYTGVSHAFGFWKGRVALYAILKALELQAGDEVIVPAFTCVVVPNSVRFAGATPVFADIDPRGYNLDPVSVEKSITHRTRVLIVQHSFGIPAPLDELLAIAKAHKLQVIEDCAHSLGSSYRGKLIGTFGKAAFFSTQWSKPYTTGLGGMAVTSDPDLAKKLRQIHDRFDEPPRSQVRRVQVQRFIHHLFFRPRAYWLAVDALRVLSTLNVFVGSSGAGELDSHPPQDKEWRLSDDQAATGLKRLGAYDPIIDHRRDLARFYQHYLEANGWPSEAATAACDSVYLRYPLRVGNKQQILERAVAARVELGSWFDSPIHPIQRSMERFGYHPGQCPIAEKTASQVVNLPLHYRVTKREAERIVKFFCLNAQPVPSRAGDEQRVSSGHKRYAIESKLIYE